MNEIAERLAVIIEAKTGGAVNELKKTATSAEQLQVEQDKAALSAAKMTAAQDKLAASLAKQQVAEAKAAGGASEIAAAQSASAAATERASVSKAQAAAASDRLAVSELQAKEAALALGTTATGTTGLLERLGLAGTSVGAVLSTLTPLLGFAALGIGIKILKDGIANFQELTGQVRGMRNVIGGSAQDVSLLVGEMKQLGVEPDNASKAFQRFGASIGDGTSKLDDFGVSVARNKDGTVDLIGTLDNVRRAYQASSDASEKDALTKALAGRQAQALIPLLKQTDDQVKDLNKHTRESGGVFTDQDLQHGYELKLASNQMKEAFDNIELGLAKGFVPALAQGLRYVTETVDKLNSVKIPGSGGGGGGGGIGFTDILGGILRDPGAAASGNLFKGLTENRQKDADATAKQKAASDVHAEALKKEKDAQDALTSSLTGEINARRTVNQAAQDFTNAQQDEADAQDKLNKLLWEGAVDEKAVAAAKKDVEHASRSVRDAIEAEHDAQEALNKARERATQLDLAEAQSKVTLAGDKITQARAAEQQAQEKLDALLGSGNATAGQIAAAQADLKQRHDEVAQALIDQGRAQEDLTKTQQKGTDQDPDVIAAQRRVRDAHEQVTDAVDAQREAVDKLHTAEAGDPDWARKVADARQDLANAHQNVADAQQAQVTAALALQTATDKMNTSLGTSATNLQAVIDKFTLLKAQGLDVDEILSILGISPTAADLPPGIEGVNPNRSASPYRPSSFPTSTNRGGVSVQIGTVQTTGTPKDISRELSWSIATTVLPKIHQGA